MVIHGTADSTVNIVNGDQVTAQWVRTDDRSVGKGNAKGYVPSDPTWTEEDQVPGGYSYTVYGYNNTLTGQNLIRYVKGIYILHKILNCSIWNESRLEWRIIFWHLH